MAVPFEIGNIQYVSGILYVVTLLVAGWYHWQLPAEGKRYTRVILVVLCVSTVGAFLQGAGVGDYQSAVDTDTSWVQFIDDTVAYAGLFGLTGLFAGASRRMVALIAGLSAGSRILIEVGGLFGGGIIVLALLGSFASYFARIYLLWFPVWRTAKSHHPRRRLLYRKSRNILMFLIGVAIIVGVLGGVGLFTNFIQQFILAYIDFFIRVAFVAFLISNVDAMWSESESTVPTTGVASGS
jgi:hypothetical protein